MVFGINHTMVDFQNDRKKDLDLVICQPAIGLPMSKHTLATIAGHYAIELTKDEHRELQEMPTLRSAPVGNVLIALEAKACMTAHQKALPRLYDELNSSHSTVHGAHDLVIAAGFVAINAAPRFLSPERNTPYDDANLVWNEHNQPKAVAITVDRVKQLRRRSKPGTDGYDALAISVIECANDGAPVVLHTNPPAPQQGDTYHYASMIDRLRGLYETRFASL